VEPEVVEPEVVEPEVVEPEVVEPEVVEPDVEPAISEPPAPPVQAPPPGRSGRAADTGGLWKRAARMWRMDRKPKIETEALVEDTAEGQSGEGGAPTAGQGAGGSHGDVRGHYGADDPAASEDVMQDASELERLQAELEDWRSRCYREAANLENIRRRARMDAEDARRFANERILSALVPVLDNLELAVEAAEQSNDVQVLIEGVRQIQRQFQDILAAEGVERIPALGERFDPNMHEAIMQVEPEEGQHPQQVVEELRPGYKLNDRVVRPALVKVTRG
jgi:molecular chaperone GrpE